MSSKLVEDDPDEKDQVLEVTGIVSDSDGRPIRGARVIISWQQIRKPRKIATGETSGDGRYKLKCTIPKNAPQPVLLMVEASSDHLKKPLLSPVTSAKPLLVIDLAAQPIDKSEWATLVRKMEPLLEGLKLDELVENEKYHDITFLARELGRNTEVVMQIVIASRLGRSFKIPAAVFYAFLRKHIPNSLPSSLLEASQSFTMIDSLVQSIGSSIFTLSPQVMQRTLTAAVTTDLIGPQFKVQIPDIVAQLQELRAKDLLNQPYNVGKSSLADLLSVVSLTPAKQALFVQALAANSASMSDFWKNLRYGTQGLTPAEVSAIQHTLSIGSLVRNFVPLVKLITAKFSDGTFSALSNLACLSIKDWVGFLQTTGTPPNIEPTAGQDAVTVFASEIYSRVTRSFPTIDLGAKVATSNWIPDDLKPSLVQFFKNNQDLELTNNNFATYLASRGEAAFAGIDQADRPKVIKAVRSFQRVLRLSPNPLVTQKLLAAGFTSATKIVMLGRQQFTSQAAAAGLTMEEATLVHGVANTIYANVVSTYMRMNYDALGVWPQAMGSLSDLQGPIQQAISQDPNLTTLFGSQSYCAVNNCTSVLSPAAYLCDLLMWLKNHNQTGGTAFDVLNARRQDIGNLLLNCPNTDTELPYIDLVNELLEDQINPPTDPNSPTNPIWKQTPEGITAEQLAAAPLYFNQGAYVKLFSAAYPQTLPYSAGLDELRTYLKHWNLPLWQLHQALLPINGTATTDQQAAVASERLGLNIYGQQMITTIANTTVAQSKFWNDPNDPTVDLVPVPSFLQSSHLTYESLKELLDVNWVQNGINVSIQGSTDQCDTSTQSLSPSPLDIGFLDRTNRFLRLWRTTGYKMWELDMLLMAPAIGNGILNNGTLVALQSFWELQQATGLQVNQLLAFYQDIDTASHRDPDGSTTIPLYSQLFLNPTVTWVAPDSDLSALLSGGAIADPVLSDHLKALQPALGVSGADAVVLCGLTDNQLTLSNLSSIYRVSALAKAAGFPISSLLQVAVLLSPTAGTPAAALSAIFASPESTLTFLEQANVIMSSGLTLDAMTYLLTPPSSSPTTPGWATTTQMTQDHVVSALEYVQATASQATGNNLDGAIIAAVASVAHTSSETALANDITALALENLQVPGTGQTLLQILEDPSLVAPTGTITIGGNPVVGDTIQVILQDNSGHSTTVQYTLVAGDAGNVNQCAADLVHAINLSSAVVGGTAFLAPCTSSADVIIITALQSGQNVRGSATTGPGGAGHVSISPNTFTVNGLPTVAPEQFPNQFLAIQLVDKVGILIRALNLVATDFGWLIKNANVYGGLDFTRLPVAVNQQPLGLSLLLETLLIIKLARTFIRASPSSAIQTLYDVISGVSTGALATESQVQGALQTITGWPLGDIQAFAYALGYTFPDDYKVPEAYDALRTLETMAAAVSAAGAVIAAPSTTLNTAIDGNRTDLNVLSDIGFPLPNFYIQIGSEIMQVTNVGGPNNTAWTVVRGCLGTTKAPAAAGASVTTVLGAQIVAWAAVPTDEPTAEALAASALGAIKAQQPGDSTWLKLAPSLSNPVRENRSAALQAYLTSQRDANGNLIYPDSNALFDHFLIDVNTSSCEPTSRIVQAYLAVQVFVERCFLNKEAPAVVVDLSQDETWSYWSWMSRYRLWEANREVFLYPENWLIESERENRTEIFQKLEQEVRQHQSTADELETVVLNYIDRLDGLAHLKVTGTCSDLTPTTETVYVVARTLANPPVYYIRSFVKPVQGGSGAWSGWTQISLDIKARQVVPAVFRGNLCLFWLDLSILNDQPQPPAAQPDSFVPGTVTVANTYVKLGVNFSIFRNGSWAPAQASKGKFFDKPEFSDDANNTQLACGFTTHTDHRVFEELYSIKVQSAPTSPGDGANLWIDIFRMGDFEPYWSSSPQVEESGAVHLGRAVFDGRFSDLQLNNGLEIFMPGTPNDGSATAGDAEGMLDFAQNTDDPDRHLLLPLPQPDGPIWAEPCGLPKDGAIVSDDPESSLTTPQTAALAFTSGSLEANPGHLLDSAPLPFRVVGPASDIGFNPTSYFFFEDSRRCYYVEAITDYWNGNSFSAIVPSNPSSTQYEIFYNFHVFYHPFTRLLWHQLSGGGFDLLYDPHLQLVPDEIETSGADVFSFSSQYNPTGKVDWDHANINTTLAADIDAGIATISVNDDIWANWVTLPPNFYVQIGDEILQVLSASGTGNKQWNVQRGQLGTAAAPAAAGTAVNPTYPSQDRQFFDFSPDAAFSVYHWELFYHIPLYIAQLLSQNQQFDDARVWLQYVFNPTRQGSEPAPQRYWIPKPLRTLTSAATLQENIDNILALVNQKDPASVAQVVAWQNNAFQPFLIADLRPVAYMKAAVMSYLDNLIAWGDSLFTTPSREAFEEATLMYVTASEILGPQPQAVPPPPRHDNSFNQLNLDAFANAIEEIENYVSVPLTNGGGGSSTNSGIPPPYTFYFKIPPNKKLLGYWTKVAKRLFKLRHCQSKTGAPITLALFDAPIDPGLLVQAQASGDDTSSVLSDIIPTLPNYRFGALFSQANDFVNAVRSYGALLLAALEKSDAGALSLLVQNQQQQLLSDGDQVLDWQAQQAQSNVNALNQALTLAKARQQFYQSQVFANPAELIGLVVKTEAGLARVAAGGANATASVVAAIPNFQIGVAGVTSSPFSTATWGGKNLADAIRAGASAINATADFLDTAAAVASTLGGWQRRMDNWVEGANEATIQIAQTQAQLDAANFALQVAQKNKDLHQEQIDNIQNTIDFLTNKFTSESLYDWMVSQLSATYFQSYQLAYQVCKQVELAYQYELGIFDSSFIQFGYWNSLYKGLTAGESLAQDLRRMQASYTAQNSRRYEISRFVSLKNINSAALADLLDPNKEGICSFWIDESLFDNDYPGHYNRRLVRVSMTVQYPNPGKFDNIKATLTMGANKVRVSSGLGGGAYQENKNPPNSDPRFVYTYNPVSQAIVMGNAQDDPGLFATHIANNLSDPRYLPFEGAGAISYWTIEMHQANNEIDLSKVTDVILHLYYTALGGGATPP